LISSTARAIVSGPVLSNPILCRNMATA
jgi:hypothetical protein